MARPDVMIALGRMQSPTRTRHVLAMILKRCAKPGQGTVHGYQHAAPLRIDNVRGLPPISLAQIASLQVIPPDFLIVVAQFTIRTLI